MRSARQALSKDRFKALMRSSTRWFLALAFITVPLAIAGVTWAPTTALGAGASGISGDAAPNSVVATVDSAATAQAIVVAQNVPTSTARRQAASNGLAQPKVSASVVPSAAAVLPPSVSSAGYRSPGLQHKIAVSDRQQLQTLKARGARVIADYGSFVLLEADGTVADSVNNVRGAQVVDENNLVLLNAGTVDTTTAPAQAQRGKSGAGSGKQMRLIQFAGPIRPEWYKSLEATGAQIVTYIPNNAYLVYGNPQALQAVQQLASDASIAQWDAAYTAFHRVDPAITALGGKEGSTQGSGKGSQPANLSPKGNEQFTIQLVDDPAENPATLALIDQYRLEPTIKQEHTLGYVNVYVAMPRDVVVNQLAQRGDVVSIQQWIVPQKRDERQNIIITGNVTGNPAVPPPTNYLAYLTGKGFSISTASTFAVNISDSGVDNATTTPNHFALYTNGDPTNPVNSRIIYNRLVGTPNTGSSLQGLDGHGNENTHIIGGYVPTGTLGGVNFGAAPHADASGFRYGLGIAPFVKVGSSVIFDPDTFTSPNYATLESQAYSGGARISSNSWGSSANNYTADAQAYDALVRDAQPATSPFPAAGNQEYVIVFAAGNAGSGANTVGSPSTAKNVITVGASENVNPFSVADGCGISDTGADNANDIISFSSRGPTADGRNKPDIVAPGTHVTGGAAQASIASPTGSGLGAQIAGFTGNGVCGGSSTSAFFPSGQQWYTASSGTSHSTPAIAGVTALIRQHFTNLALPAPSPAMTKALLLNSARYMNGTGANDTLPSNTQGMGEVSLNSYFDVFAATHSLHDELPSDLFTATGQQRIITGNVIDNARPFRVTLAWTDTPGPTTGAAYVNNLDLEVTVGGNTYKGNVFSGAASATGGVADTKNNVESVFIPAGVTGPYIIKVTATNIAGDGVPNNASPLDQDFALVIYNGNEAPAPVIVTGAASVAAESCSPANSVIDPSENVTLTFALSNVGTLNTTNLVATLQASGGVSSPGLPQTYGPLVAGGPSVARPFTFTVGTTCGQMLVATLHLQDGAVDLGNVTFSIRTGALGAPATLTYSTGNIATAIPDAGTVDVPINIVDTGFISDVNVRVRANHTFDQDITFQLIGPDGTTVPLVQARGGSGDNFGTGANDCSGTPTVFDDSAATAIAAGVAPFAGTFRPEGSLAAFNGKSVTGQWKLHATDSAAQDTGTLFCVQLEIARQKPVCCGVPGTPLIVSGGAATIAAENFVPPNNTPDPGETVTVTIPLLNAGDGNTTNLVATLQNSGGVTPVTITQNYGVVVAAGATVSKPFTFVANGVCGGTITLTLHLQDGALDLGNLTYTFTLGTTNITSQTFSNAAAMTIPGSGTGASTGAPASLYPSNIVVSGAPATINQITVKLKNFSHTFPDDVDVLLVSPTGRKMIIMSDAGGGTDAVSLDITLDDAAVAALTDSGALTSGAFQATNFGTGDLFPAPAPAAPYLSAGPAGTDTLTSAFTGVAGGNPNGTWSLYVVDDSGVDTGSMNGGWEITLSVATPVCSSAPPLALVSAQSRLVHGAAGTFDLPLTLVAPPGINHNPTTEPRQGATQSIVFTFNNAVNGATAAISEGTATAGVPTFSGNDVIVPLTGIANQQYVTLDLTNVTPTGGGAAIGASARIGFLVGDVNQSRVISVADLGLVNAALAQPVTAANYLKDVNSTGTLTVADKGITNANLTKTLPAP